MNFFVNFVAFCVKDNKQNGFARNSFGKTVSKSAVGDLAKKKRGCRKAIALNVIV